MLGNIIGLDVTGTVDLGNIFVGVGVGLAATGNVIGDVGNGRNIISGNNQFGVRLVDTGTSNNRVQNNYIGLDVTGTLARGNSSDGVRLECGRRRDRQHHRGDRGGPRQRHLRERRIRDRGSATPCRGR